MWIIGYAKCKAIINRANTQWVNGHFVGKKYSSSTMAVSLCGFLFCLKSPDIQRERETLTHSTDKLTNRQCLSFYGLCVFYTCEYVWFPIEVSSLRIPWERFCICSPFNRIRLKSIDSAKATYYTTAQTHIRANIRVWMLHIIKSLRFKTVCIHTISVWIHKEKRNNKIKIKKTTHTLTAN